MANQSAGILLYRSKVNIVEVLLVHPGGPFWAKKDDGAWSIPKGEFSEDEDPFEAAKREFLEETGTHVDGKFTPLGSVKQPGGKVVYAWALKGDCDPSTIKSNTFVLQWPPGSGKEQEFPEVDRAGWFAPATARKKILKGQVVFIDRLLNAVAKETDSEKEPAGEQ
jgi:predicted NUDIX family NTP pyrophosphohydrolase